MWSFSIELGGFLWTIPSERLSNIHPVFCLHTYVGTDLIPYSTEIDLDLGKKLVFISPEGENPVVFLFGGGRGV